MQDYWLNDVQLEILKTLKRTNTDFTAGIIGNHFGEDDKLISFFNEMIKDEKPEVVLANNGWEYEDFTSLSLNEQNIILKKSNDKIANVLGKKPGFEKVTSKVPART